MGVWFVHPWVTTLSQSGILLVILDGGSLRDFALELSLKLVEGALEGVILLVNIRLALAIEESR